MYLEQSYKRYSGMNKEKNEQFTGENNTLEG